MPNFQFRLPKGDDLTETQQLALYQDEALLVDGGPGSGKTVVSIYRFLLRVEQSRRDALFFTFNRTLMASIKGMLNQRADLEDAGGEASLFSLQVNSIYEWYTRQCGGRYFSSQNRNDNAAGFASHLVAEHRRKYTEVFVDESQDLHPFIIGSLHSLAERVSCGADRSQDLQRHYTRPADDVIEELLNEHQVTRRHTLEANFRNTRETFALARRFVPQDMRVQRLELTDLPVGEEPAFLCGLARDVQHKKILEIIEAFPGDNVGIILHSRGEIDQLRQFFRQQGYRDDGKGGEANSFSYYYEGMDYYHRQAMEQKLCTPFVLTYESCKGLEFDVVIMPGFDSADEWGLSKFKKTDNGEPRLDAKGNPMTWTTPNHYYVAATRARKKLYILCEKPPAAFPFLR